jgi:hypothetical protein
MSLENLNMSVGGCQHEASVQVESASALDAKLMGILAFMGAAAGVLLTVDNALSSYRWILLVGAAGAIVFTILGLIGPDDPRSGPDPIDFYKEYGAAEPAAFAEQLVANFGRTLAKNKEHVEERRTMLSVAVAWAATTGIVFGLARALVAILA